MINHPNRKAKDKAAAAPRTSPRAATSATPAHDHDRDYSALLAGARTTFQRAVAAHTRVYSTDVDGLWDTYLSSLPAGEQRQIHNCHCCRRFIQTYGGLVSIDLDGRTKSVMWDRSAVPEFYADSVDELEAYVKIAKVTGVFLTAATTWGTPRTGDWEHISVVPPADLVHRDRVLDANQATAAVRENVKTVVNALVEYRPKVIEEALRLLKAEKLERSEKFVAPLRWLLELHSRPKGKLGDNLLWRTVALAPEGFCHIKSSVLGPLLDDVAAGVPFAEIQRRHAAKLHPLNYQRAQVAPSEGNVKAAEALVEKMGIAPSLERRFARLADMPLQHAIWVPRSRSVPAGKGGVFGHLSTKQDAPGVKSVDLPSTTMTWDKFVRTVVPEAQQIELLVPSHGAFFAFLTAVHADAPPILKWDRLEERNPVSWYTYNNGSAAFSWGLAGGQFVRVNAVMPFSNLWGERPMPHLTIGAMLILEGCADTRTNQGNALFMEQLSGDMHGIRSTIEAYSKSAIIQGEREGLASGYGLHNSQARCELRALIGSGWNRYSIDRWD